MMVSLHTVSLTAVAVVRLVVRLVVVALRRLTLLLVAEIVVWQVTDHILVVFLLARLPRILLRYVSVFVIFEVLLAAQISIVARIYLNFV